MQRLRPYLLFGVLALVLTACVAGSPESGEMAAGGWFAQLMLGFWHGMIAPVTLTLYALRTYAPWAANMIPPALWHAWTVYDDRASSFAYNVGFCFGLFLLPAFIWPRPRF